MRITSGSCWPEIRAFIHRWLDVDPFYEQLASYYVMFTWL